MWSQMTECLVDLVLFLFFMCSFSLVFNFLFCLSYVWYITIIRENFIYNIVVVHQSVFIFLNFDAKVVEALIASEVVASALSKNNYIIMFTSLSKFKKIKTLWWTITMLYINVIVFAQCRRNYLRDVLYIPFLYTNR